MNANEIHEMYLKIQELHSKKNNIIKKLQKGKIEFTKEIRDELVQIGKDRKIILRFE